MSTKPEECEHPDYEVVYECGGYAVYCTVCDELLEEGNTADPIISKYIHSNDEISGELLPEYLCRGE